MPISESFNHFKFDAKVQIFTEIKTDENGVASCRICPVVAEINQNVFLNLRLTISFSKTPEIF